MRNKLRLLAVALVAGGTMFAQSRLSIGVRIGGYGPGSYRPPAYTQQRHDSVNNYRTPPRYVNQRDDNAYRHYDRGDRGRELDRGYGDKYQSCGNEHAESRSSARFDSRTSRQVDKGDRAYSNDFRR
jgi:hypothetical protein